MLSRGALWGHLAGASAWPLAWAMGGACALPWVLPETWNGQLPSGSLLARGLLWLASLALLRYRRWLLVPLALGLMGLTALGLARRGVREPIHLILTHPHGDYAGGWATLSRIWPLASTTVPVTAGEGDPWEPYRPIPAPELEGLLRGDTWRRGEATYDVRWPPTPLWLPDPNMASVVLWVGWRDRELWLMADALSPQEADLLDLGEPGPLTRHRLLKAGHHGSRNTSSPEWLAAL